MIDVPLFWTGLIPRPFKREGLLSYGGDALEKRRIGVSRWTGLVLSLFLVHVFPVSAQDAWNDSRIDERLQSIRRMIEHDKSNADRWWYGWLIGYSAATAAQVGVGLASKEKNTREDMALGAATTFLGAVGQIVTPLVPGHVGDCFSDTAASPPAQQKEQLAKAEQWLKELARRERNGKSWKIHVLNETVNLGSGLVLWLGFKRSFWEGVGNFLINTAVTEIQIWTQPIGVVHDYETYVKKFDSGQTMGHSRPDPKWFVTAYPGGLGIRVEF